MPIYEFQCLDCGFRFEELMSSEARAATCSACGASEVHRLLSPVSAPTRQPRGVRVKAEESRRCEREAARGERLAEAKRKRAAGELFYHRQGLEFTRYAISHFLEVMAGKWKGSTSPGGRGSGGGATLHAKSGLMCGRARNTAAPHHRSTPAFFIGPTGGRAKPLLHFSLTEAGAFDEAVEGVLGA